MFSRSAYTLSLLLGLTAVSLCLPSAVADTGSVTGQQSDDASLENYLLAPFDQITVTVFDEPDLATTQRLTSKGEITIPLLGTVRVKDLSIEAAKEKIEKLFISEEYLRSPEVFLTIDEFSPKRVTILGEVNSPSSFALPMGANYLEIEAAIAMAGGFTDLAKESAIRVTRKDGPNGRERVVEVNMDDVLTKSSDGFADNRFRIFPGDILYVPRRIF